MQVINIEANLTNDIIEGIKALILSFDKKAKFSLKQKDTINIKDFEPLQDTIKNISDDEKAQIMDNLKRECGL